MNVVSTALYKRHVLKKASMAPPLLDTPFPGPAKSLARFVVDVRVSRPNRVLSLPRTMPLRPMGSPRVCLCAMLTLARGASSRARRLRRGFSTGVGRTSEWVNKRLWCRLWIPLRRSG